MENSWWDDPNRENNAHHVVTGSGTDASAVIEGFTITGAAAFSHDNLDSGGGMIIDAGSPTIRNCIIWGNSLPAFSGNPSVSFSDVEGGWPGEGNLDRDPLFAAEGYWDPNGTVENTSDDVWVDGDYHPKSRSGRWYPLAQAWVQDDVTSVCIDAGDPDTPVGFEQLPNGGVINMGAYGGSLEAGKSVE